MSVTPQVKLDSRLDVAAAVAAFPNAYNVKKGLAITGDESAKRHVPGTENTTQGHLLDLMERVGYRIRASILAAGVTARLGVIDDIPTTGAGHIRLHGWVRTGTNRSIRLRGEYFLEEVAGSVEITTVTKVIDMPGGTGITAIDFNVTNSVGNRIDLTLNGDAAVDTEWAITLGGHVETFA